MTNTISLEPTIRYSDLGEKIYFYSIQQLEHMKNVAEINRLVGFYSQKFSSEKENEFEKVHREREQFQKYLRKLGVKGETTNGKT